MQTPRKAVFYIEQSLLEQYANVVSENFRTLPIGHVQAQTAGGIEYVASR
jgi:hypothetical protein